MPPLRTPPKSKSHQRRHPYGRPRRGHPSGPNNMQQLQPSTTQQHRQETEDEKIKRESEIRMPRHVVEEFKRDYHEDRAPPNPSACPAEFQCIHCLKMVKREENDNPWVC
ncbi:hypothetical protein F5Y08DRAFT_339469 [Xylaria arbuscula]|nr:hypothetical protein F5Y08DRAFT_339469 [Xylaria arbuscula]